MGLPTIFVPKQSIGFALLKNIPAQEIVCETVRRVYFGVNIFFSSAVSRSNEIRLLFFSILH